MKEEGVGHYPNLVIVEGGKVAVRKYKILLLRRIKWAQKEDNNSDEDIEEDKQKKNELKSTKHCSLVWEGKLQKRFFDKWRVIEANSEHDAIRALSERGCGHYWNSMLSHKLE